MSDKFEIRDEELDEINGGAITYTWDGEQGSLGMNGKNKYKLVDKAAFLDVYKKMFGKTSDVDIIKELYAQGIIQKP